MNILLTGGTGYIGSHTAVDLLAKGYHVTILDNLSNSKEDVLQKIKKFQAQLNLNFIKAIYASKKVLIKFFKKMTSKV